MHRWMVIGVLVVLAVILSSETVESCSCMPKHPQETYCDSDYVIVARVLRRMRIRKNTYHQQSYKLDIKRTYKMNEKAADYLKDGRVTTAGPMSSCNIDLSVGRLYAFAGNSSHLNTCSYVKEYSTLSIVEKRGLAGGYKKGCHCGVHICHSGGGCNPQVGACNWNPWFECETSYGVCVPSKGLVEEDGRPSKCHWRRNPAYNSCLSNP